MLSTQPDVELDNGLDLTTLRSRPEWKTKVRRLNNCATRGPQEHWDFLDSFAVTVLTSVPLPRCFMFLSSTCCGPHPNKVRTNNCTGYETAPTNHNHPRRKPRGWRAVPSLTNEGHTWLVSFFYHYHPKKYKCQYWDQSIDKDNPSPCRHRQF